ncbi:unnamed protein product [Phytomonas sp. Hart1]|nr:unnamed protein product [Phytomonas sp. Hart1]|eukprot:CCW66966.1 unnamed protein product [Phytomonas sp. isolate Hart1]
MHRDFRTLKSKVNNAIHENYSLIDCSEISNELSLALASSPDSDELKALNYRYQTYLGKKYVKDHALDIFLSDITQQLLKRKSEQPLQEILEFLNKNEIHR